MSQSFWERDPAEVAKALIGFKLLIGNQEAYILDVSAWECSEQDRGLYRPMHDMRAGEVYCPRLMNSVLLAIVTGQGKSAGSRVRIDDIELRGARYTGPGIVTSALGITVGKSKGTAELIDDGCIAISLDTIPLRRPRHVLGSKPQLKVPPGIGEKALVRLLPKIVDKYLAEDPPVTFEGYLNLLLLECSTEGDLRRRVSS